MQFLRTSSSYSDVKNNSLTGVIPQNIGNCTSFQVLYVYQPNFVYFVNHHRHCLIMNICLNGRDLSYNKLTGEIPFNIGFLQVATLYVDIISSTLNVGKMILY